DAINQINAPNSTLDEIDFNITAASDIAGGGSGYNAATGVATIKPLSALPTINNPVFINGFTQPGSSPNTLPNQGAGAGDNGVQTITLDGSQISSPGDGLTIAAGGSTVEGLVIQNFTNGVHLTTNGNDLIAGNHFTNNNNNGYFNTDVLVDNVPNNTIGGTGPWARNICADGVTIQGAGATGNLLEGNFIGTDGRPLLKQGPTGSHFHSASRHIIA